ncbi:MAG: xanthine dehydrogenase family protein molybdopterin-binding subunit [Rhodovarius sp.]|nr:xanthine dehydrogenase family protein molybdopterin-binding subunit [Rhodovarius sp.]MDW8313916.1 xanthine dehydrogenase family protein molybdopterin-binding subunit [Rhodovarius sp.]
MRYERWPGRVEDAALLQGLGRFGDDVRPAEAAAAVFVRSPHAHAELLRIDAAAARGMPGVLGVFTAAELGCAELGSVTAPVPMKGADGKPILRIHRPVLAQGRVRHVGEPVALVVAESLAQALDAAEAVVADYAPLPAVTSAAEALRSGAPELWPGEVPGNLALDWVGPEDPDGSRAAALEAAFAQAACIARLRLHNQRLAPVTLEPRTATAFYDARTGSYTLRCGTQGAAGMRQQLAATLRIPPEQLRILSEDVGGGFGTKASAYPEYAALLVASRLLDRPLHWVSTRSEAFLTDNQGRDSDWTAELALDREGRFLGLRIEGIGNLGAYQTGVGALVHTGLFLACLPGMYDIPLLQMRVRCALTNTVPTGPYRGAGRPEANFLLERLVEEAGRLTGLGPVEIRRRNLIPPQRMPYLTAAGTTYDSGDFPAVFEKALQLADVAGFPDRRAAAERRGRRRGIGIACFLENAGVFPEEPARISFPGDGTIRVSVHPVASGQGHATVFGALAARLLGVPRELVRLTAGDSARDVLGFGAVASRSAMMTGGAIAVTAEAVLAKARRVAALLLQAREEDIAYRNGRFGIAGEEGGPTLVELAARAAELARQGVIAEGLDTTGKVHAPLSFPNGCHVAEVELDPETGCVELISYCAVDDCGRVLDPVIVAGQIQGGVAQGVGQALLEEVAYDGQSGQLLSASLMDYALPRASDLPDLRSEHLEVPCLTNPLGVKGTGEAGTTAAPPAVFNAVADALAPCDASALDMPLTAEKIWRVLRGR